MRTTLLLVLTILTIEASGQNETEVQFAKRVLRALTTKDFEKVKELFPTTTQWDRFAVLTDKPLPDNFSEAYIEERKQEFERLFRLADKYEINWMDFKINKLNLESNNLQDTEAIGLTGRLTLKFKKRKVTLDEVSFMKLDSKYYLMSIRNLINGTLSTGKD
jgi:hypothetical protein